MLAREDLTGLLSCHFCGWVLQYPGWLSAMARLLYPDVIDIAYAASAAPTTHYAQLVDSIAYYEHVSMVADKCQSGCSANVKSDYYASRHAYTYLYCTCGNVA
jgi:hypothetical protein